MSTGSGGGVPNMVVFDDATSLGQMEATADARTSSHSRWSYRQRFC